MRPDSKPTPRTLFRVFAGAEMVTWALLVCALLLRGAGLMDIVPIAGGIHGFVFLSYATVTIFTWVNQKWSAGLGLLGLILATVPFATVPFDLFLDKRGQLAGGWRLAPGGQAPRGMLERAQAWVLSRPILASVILLSFVITLFIVLLLAGPPIPKN